MKLVAYAIMIVMLIPTLSWAKQVVGSFKEAATAFESEEP
jgi:hypothetical protein